MDKIPDASGHFYKHLMVLGTFLAVVSIYGFSVTLKAHDEKVEQGVLDVLLEKDVPAEKRDYWQRTLAIRHKNAYYTLPFLLGCAAVGVGMALLGGWWWYSRVQVFEDESRRLEMEKLRHQVKNKLKPSTES